jgi:hypothetical protein
MHKWAHTHTLARDRFINYSKLVNPS